LNPFRKADFSKVDTVIDALYYSISFDESREPYWSLLESLFVDKARLVHSRENNYVSMELEQFISNFMKEFRLGTYKTFKETELHRITETYGNICHVFSTFQAVYTTGDGTGETRGINSIQLVFEDHRWWITSILWFDEDTKRLIPASYLPRN
jgi:hypothetical protein